MTAPKLPLDLVRDEIMKHVGPEMDKRFEQLIPIFTRAMKRDELDTIEVPPAIEPISPGTAAKRTTVQGVIAVVLGGIFGFATEAVSDDSFQVFDLGDWKGLGTGAITAGVMAVLAYGMRKIGR